MILKNIKICFLILFLSSLASIAFCSEWQLAATSGSDLYIHDPTIITEPTAETVLENGETVAENALKDQFPLEGKGNVIFKWLLANNYFARGNAKLLTQEMESVLENQYPSDYEEILQILQQATNGVKYTENTSTWYALSTSLTPGVPIKSSSDGHTWTNAGQVFTQPLSWWTNYVPNWNPNGVTNSYPAIDVWAPDIVQYNGRFMIFYAISTFGSQTSVIGLVESPSIAGTLTSPPTNQWKDDGLVINSTTGSPYNAIDPSFTLDATGQPWLSFGSFWGGIYVVKLDPTTLKPTSTPQRIAYSSAIEGSNIIYRYPYYYLFASKGYCCRGVDSTYHIVFGRSKSITGPYKDKDGTSLLNNGGSDLLKGPDKSADDPSYDKLVKTCTMIPNGLSCTLTPIMPQKSSPDTCSEIQNSYSYSTMTNVAPPWEFGPGGEDIYYDSNSNNYIMINHYYDGKNCGLPTMDIWDLNWTSDNWPTLKQ